MIQKVKRNESLDRDRNQTTVDVHAVGRARQHDRGVQRQHAGRVAEDVEAVRVRVGHEEVPGVGIVGDDLTFAVDAGSARDVLVCVCVVCVCVCVCVYRWI